MKYTLKTAMVLFSDIEYIKKLITIGFKFRRCKSCYGKIYLILNKPTIEINTLEELNDFVKKFGRIVIDGTEITIYDDYLE